MPSWKSDDLSDAPPLADEKCPRVIYSIREMNARLTDARARSAPIRGRGVGRRVRASEVGSEEAGPAS